MDRDQKGTEIGGRMSEVGKRLTSEVTNEKGLEK